MKQVLQRVWNYFLPSKEPKWKSIWNIESSEGKWEITIPDNINTYLSRYSQGFKKHESKSYTRRDVVVLMYVPNDMYDDKVIRIECTFGDFEDLLKLIKQIT